jgi:hypothetical protein
MKCSLDSIMNNPPRYARASPSHNRQRRPPTKTAVCARGTRRKFNTSTPACTTAETVAVEAHTVARKQHPDTSRPTRCCVSTYKMLCLSHTLVCGCSQAAIESGTGRLEGGDPGPHPPGEGREGARARARSRWPRGGQSRCPAQLSKKNFLTACEGRLTYQAQLAFKVLG